MNPVSPDSALALAGVFQAALLAQQSARKGMVDHAPLVTTLDSVFIQDAPTVADVYGGTAGVRMGLRFLTSRFDGRLEALDAEVTGYSLSLVQLAGKLSRQASQVQDLGGRIAGLSANRDPGSAEFGAVCKALADLYVEFISPLSPRIKVMGEQGFLAREEIANQVRALLLGGIRSAFLWQQLGGRRWHLLVFRGSYVRNAGMILRGAETL